MKNLIHLYHRINKDVNNLLNISNINVKRIEIRE